MKFGNDDILDADMPSIDRRTTLHGLAGVLGTSIVGGGVASGQQSPESRNAPTLNSDQIWNERFEESTELRETVANQLIDEIAESESPYERSRDEDQVVRRPGPQDGDSYRPFAYCKALGYDSELGISTDRQAELISALVDGEADYPLGAEEGLGDRPQVSPPAMNAYATEGTDPWLGAMPPAYSVFDDGSDVQQLYAYAEMLECYSATYYRHNPFDSIGEDPIPGLGDALLQDGLTITSALDDAGVNETLFAWIAGPTLPERVFRDAFYGCQTGPYVTQHFAHEIPLSGSMVTTAEPTVSPIVSDPYGTTPEEFADIRAGTTPGAEPGHGAYDVGDGEFGPELGEERYIHTGQDLASYVRADPSYTTYLYAALQLAEWGASLSEDVPYSDDNTDSLSYVDSGGATVVDQLARVARNGLLAAWHQKWRVHRRLRPESYAERIAAARSGGQGGGLPASTPRNGSPGNGSPNNGSVGNSSQSSGPPASVPPLSNLLEYWTNSNTLDLLESEEPGNALLPLAYPEGSPAHPSYPSGHSVIAGACATALKAFHENDSFDDLDVDPRYNTDGTESGFEPTSAELDVHGEINKLASNIGMGRIFAGVHYRTDHIYGMLLGEQIAVATLYDHYVSNVRGNSERELTFTTLIGGEERTISPETFVDLRQAALGRAGLRP